MVEITTRIQISFQSEKPVIIPQELISYQAAIMNLEDGQKKEELLGVPRKASTSLMLQLRDLKQELKRKKDKQQDVRDDPGWQEEQEKKRRRKTRRRISRKQ